MYFLKHRSDRVENKCQLNRWTESKSIAHVKIVSPHLILIYIPKHPSIKSLYFQTSYLLTRDLKHPHKYTQGVKLNNRLFIYLSLLLEPAQKYRVVKKLSANCEYFPKNISIVSKLNSWLCSEDIYTYILRTFSQLN